MAPRSILLPVATALAALGVASSAQAAVDVSLDRGVLAVTGGADPDQIAIAGDDRRIRVTVGSTEHSFRRSAVHDVVVRLGDGEDRVRLDAGVAARIEGGEGFFDAVTVVGSEYDDELALTAAGDRARVRGEAHVDLETLERVEFETAGGEDSVTVGDVTGTVVNDVEADLGADQDRLQALGTPEPDFTDTSGGPADVFLFGLPALVRARNAEDVAMRGLAGDDRMNASSSAPVTLDGGTGGDDLDGGPAADLLLGGPGDDFVAGDGGDDRAFLDGGFDIFLWDPGDGSDSVEGGRGTSDVMLFRGSGDAERFQLSADGRRTRLLRDVGSIAMDFDGMEKVEVGLRAGADRFDVGDMSRTDVGWVVAELASGIAGQSLDQAADAITVEGTRRDDAIAVADTVGGVRVSGLPAMVDVLRPEPALDTLTLATGSGDDTVDQSAMTPGAIGLAVE
jgi:hypothetical protein